MYYDERSGEKGGWGGGDYEHQRPKKSDGKGEDDGGERERKIGRRGAGETGRGDKTGVVQRHTRGY